MHRNAFRAHLLFTNTRGSNRASSYLRALDMLGEILASSDGPFSDIGDLWVQSSPEAVDRLYDYVKEQQRSGEIFTTDHAPSYWKNGFYSAALLAYRDHLIESRYVQKLESHYESGNFDQSKLDDSIDGNELLTRELDPHLATEKIRSVKTRVGHDVFKRELCRVYNAQCCVTGLNIPELNRASHIIPWADRKETRLDPSNGLLLSATYDAAFDKYLITFDEDYRMVLSSELRTYFMKQVCADHFERYEGKPISLPYRYVPKQDYLSHHRTQLRN